MRLIYILALTFVFIASCDKDCEEPEEPKILFDPHFLSDSTRVFGDFGSIYDIEFVALELASGDPSSIRMKLEGESIIITPIGAIAQTNGSDFNGTINMIDKLTGATIAIIEFESRLEGGDDSNSCINPLIKTVILRQGNRLLFDGETFPVPKIYLTQ